MSAIEPYPAERTTYNKRIGGVRVDNIALVVREEYGLTVRTYPVESNGVDLSVYDNNGEVMTVMEVTNWRRSGFFNTGRRQNTLDNLTEYPCARILVVSFMENLTNSPPEFVEDLEENDIGVLDLGFQTQPTDYYNWFMRHKPRVGLNARTPDDPHVRRTIRNKFSFLRT